ncbi:unnamed protein product [Calicophoron daubneyi]|uniref:Probable RNA polymerase II nuclear localization protein SLC7A6OS n=1 Tax=Calicophoron daubneyi TaxID=300641 RepID=A0AAV2TQ15_CALDB
MPIYLRVKRLRTDVAVDSFEPQPLPKVMCQERNSDTLAVFRYIGSQTAECDPTHDCLADLDKGVSRGSCKLLLKAQRGTIIGKIGNPAVNCEVKVNTLKRPASPPSTEGRSYSPDFEGAVSPHPCKILKIIDLTPNVVTDPLPGAFDALRIGSDLGVSDPVEEELNCVYDLYKLERKRSQEVDPPSGVCISPKTARTDSTGSASPPFHEGELVYEDDCFNQDGSCYDDEEDDSNAESNWRNDYPDEEDVEYSSSCSSFRLRSSESNSDCDDRSS